MTSARDLRSYDYVNHPYAKVRDALQKDALSVFRAATHAASDRAHKVAAALRVNVAGLEIQKDIVISITRTEEETNKADGTPRLRLHLHWEAADSPRLFPLMEAELTAYALTATETQLDFLGHYRPPMGALGNVVNTLVGHRIAEASVHRFLADVAAHLRKSLGS